MRYHPISLNVIRQALKLSALPQPVTMQKVGQVSVPTGVVLSSYRCEFDLPEMLTIATMEMEWDITASQAVALVFEGAFCNDIEVAAVDWPDGEGSVFLTIVTIFNPYERWDCNE